MSDQTGRVHVLFLGPAQDLAGTVDCEVRLALERESTVASLRLHLVDKYPGLQLAIDTMRFAVNQDFVPDDHELRDGDEVALIPPVSGGSENAVDVWVELFESQLPVDRARSFACLVGVVGAVAVFEGITRTESNDQHGPLIALEYEAYSTMALQQMRRLCDEAMTGSELERIAMLHRVGRVAVGQASVVIAVGAGHRTEAFRACSTLIERLKQDVPIWKKDLFADGHVHWVEPVADAREEKDAGR